MKKPILFLLLAFTGLIAQAQIPNGYYNNAADKTGDKLRSALHDIIDNHTAISYAQIWTAFWSTDNKGNNVVWDMYSDGAGYTYNYYSKVGDQCGSYDSEGDCYNREHSWPKSWFNGKEDSTPGRDLHHIFPTDGYVNNQRSSYPFGEVSNATWTSLNGSKLGSCKSSLGYTGIVFEPIDEYKGDFARAYFYMSTRYYGEDSDWGSSGMTEGANLKSWAITMLLNWSDNDPVSQKEIDRNEVVYGIQGNRNPFIDHPEYAHLIWEPGWSGTPYAITCATGLLHGSISAPSTAVAGTIVTLTANPDQGYELDTWTVTKTGDANTVITVSGNTFVMPAYPVTVSATFKSNANYYTITKGTVSHGTITVSPASAQSGTTINLTATPATGYCLYAWYVYKTDDVNTTVPVSTSGNNGSFTMPAYNVTVLASFTQGSAGGYVKVTSAPSDWSGEYLIVNESNNKAFNGSLTTLDANDNAISVSISNNTIASNNETDAAVFTIASMTGGYSIKAGNGQYIYCNGNSNALNTSTTATANTINLSNGSIVIKGTGTTSLQYNNSANRFRYYSSSQKAIQLYKKTSSTSVTPTHTIQFNPNGGSQSSYTQTVNEFEPTALQANSFTRENYAFYSWNTAANGSGTTYFDGATVTLLNDLVLYAQWAPTYTVTCTSVSNGTISASPTCAVEGAIITLTATPNTGYEFDHWTVTDASDNAITVIENQFEMPASNVTVSATFVYVGQPFTQKYHLVTSTDQLVAGRTYLIVNTNYNKALGKTQNTNNRSAVAVSINNNTITTLGDACELTLGGQEGAWTLYDATNNSGYLYAAGGNTTNNYLKTQTTLTNEGKWTISLDNNNKATIKTIANVNRHTIMYNNGSTIFSCYASGQQDVCLFIRSEEFDLTQNATEANLFAFDKHVIASGTTLTVTGTATCTDPNNLIIEDGAQFIHHNDGVKATVKKKIEGYTDNGGWYTIATPFTTLDPDGLLTTANYDLYVYDEDGDKEWHNYKANSFNLTTGNGYLYAHNPTTTLRMTGTINNGDYSPTVNLSYANAHESIRGYNLIGNPTAHDITFNKTAQVSDGYYYLSNSDNWVYINSNTVPAGRGFLVKANATGQSVELNPAAKGDVLPEKGQYLCITIDNEKVYVKMNEGVSMPLFGFHGHKSNLYLTLEQVEYVMLVKEDAESIDLNYKALQRGTHTLDIRFENAGADYLHLIDRLTGVDIDLLATPSYSFESNPNDFASRFLLRFTPNENTFDNDQFAYYKDGQFHLMIDANANDLQIIDATGRMIHQNSNIASGVYVLRLVTSDKIRTQKIVVR